MTIRYAGKRYQHVEEGDFAELTEFFANIFRSYGFEGHALDLAIADCLRAAATSIEQYREAKEKRGALQLVEGA